VSALSTGGSYDVTSVWLHVFLEDPSVYLRSGV